MTMESRNRSEKRIESGSINSLSILVAEDSPTQAENLRFILEQNGYVISVARNGKEALDKIQIEKPRIVISDVVMPEMDGYELCRHIKEDKNLRDIPVILLTSLSDSKDVLRGLECGANCFIVKPFQETYLLSRIQFVLANEQLRRNQSVQMGIEIYFGGQKYFITSDRVQILDLLVTTYESAVQKNYELAQVQEELRRLNEELELKVQERTVALRISEQRYRLLFDSNPLPMWVYDVDTLSFLAVNDMAVDKYEFSREEFLSMSLSDIIPSEEASLMRKSAEKDSRVFGSSTVWTHQKKNGTTIFVEVVSHPINFAGKRAKLVLANDVTERKQAEEALKETVQQKIKLEAQLRQAQKMEAIGQLAGGVAHDFNNTLMAISGYSELLSLRLSDDPQLKECVVEIQKAAAQGAQLTRQLLAFSRRQLLSPKILDLNQSISNLEYMLRRLIGSDIELVTDFCIDLGRVKADPGQIEQIIVNLVVNARDAMPQGGRLDIKTDNIDLDETYTKRHVDVSPGKYAILAVSDTGLGMDETTLTRIFEPFFTTKAEGKGTGLGLSTVYGIVKQSGGHISVYSQPKQGTTFKVYFPILDATASETVSTESEGLSGQGETVLLVDENESMRSAVGELLTARGYSVLQAGSGEQALELSQKHSQQHIHLLITDAVLPDMNGNELSQHLESDRPGMKILFMSDYTQTAVTPHQMQGSGPSFLQKPASMDALLHQIRQLIGAKAN